MLKKTVILLLFSLFMACSKENSIILAFRGYYVNPVQGAFCITPGSRIDTARFAFINTPENIIGSVRKVPEHNGYHFFYIDPKLNTQP